MTLADDPKSKGFTVNDRRFWLSDNPEDEAAPNPELLLRPKYVEELESRLNEKDKTLREYIQAHKSSLADMDQVRQRLEGDLENRVLLQKAKLADPFLDVLDNLTRLHSSCKAGHDLAEIEKGMSLVLKQLSDELKKLGLEPIQAKGEKFDPNIMEAVMTENVNEIELENQVLEVFRDGYRLGGQVVRPAAVKVGIHNEA